MFNWFKRSSTEQKKPEATISYDTVYLNELKRRLELHRRCLRFMRGKIAQTQSSIEKMQLHDKLVIYENHITPEIVSLEVQIEVLEKFLDKQ